MPHVMEDLEGMDVLKFLIQLTVMTVLPVLNILKAATSYHAL